MNTQELSKVCRQVRRDIITMTANAGSGHPGGSLSAVELMTSVFFNHMRVDPSNPHDPDRDRFVLSKGHAAPCYYAVLAAKGFISRDEYANFRQLHSILQGHPDAQKVPHSMFCTCSRIFSTSAFRATTSRAMVISLHLEPMVLLSRLTS